MNFRSSVEARDGGVGLNGLFIAMQSHSFAGRSDGALPPLQRARAGESVPTRAPVHEAKMKFRNATLHR